MILGADNEGEIFEAPCCKVLEVDDTRCNVSACAAFADGFFSSPNLRNNDGLAYRYICEVQAQKHSDGQEIAAHDI